jgi:hypothetical protein
MKGTGHRLLQNTILIFVRSDLEKPRETSVRIDSLWVKDKGQGKGKFVLWLTKHHAMKTFWQVEA